MLKEKIKTYILFSLIFLSLIQAGILWDYQGPGFPFNFLEAIGRMGYAKAVDPMEKIKQDAFEPYRLVVSAGMDEPHWVLTKNSDNQEEYSRLWSEGMYYLECILNSKNIISYDPDKDVKDWEDLAVRKGTFYEFKTPLKPGVLSYFLNTKGAKAGESNGILKMLVLPDDINNNSFSVYILDGSSKLQKYVILAKNLKKDQYDEIVAKLYKHSESNGLRSYTVIADTKNTMRYQAQKDIPIIWNGSKFELLQSINCTIPENFMIKSGQKASEIEKKFESILGSEKDSYDVSMDGSGTATLKNLNNIYKLYDGGLLEYKNLSYTTEAEKPDESQAVKTAVEFLGRMKLLSANADLYISGIQGEKDRVRITFDYKVGGLPVMFNYQAQGAEQNTLKNAITIEASNKKVISCWWILRNLEPAKEKKEYGVNFVDLMDKTFIDYPELKDDKSFYLKDATLGYEVQKDTRNAKVEPMWFIFTNTNAQYPVKLAVKKGE